nr:hypothetical protein [Tanacetum cinerariifolium]
MINAQIADLSSHNTKYTSPALTQKVFANMRRVGKGFSGVDTSLFDGMLVPQQVQDDVAGNVDDDVVDTDAEPIPPSPTPATTPPPQQTCATLTKKVGDLEQDKIAQAIEITKLKQRVRKLENKRKLKASGLKRLRKVGTAQRVKSSADTVMDDQEDASKQGGIAKIDADEDVTLEEVDAEKDAEETDEAEPAMVEEVLEVVTTAKLMTEVVTTATITITVAPIPKASAPRKRRGVIIQDSEEASTASLSVQSEEQVKRKEKQDNIVMRYQSLKRKPVTEAHVRKNMMAFLKKGEKEIEEEESKLSKRKSESSEQQAAKKQKIEEDVDDIKTYIQIVPNDEDDVYTEATPLALKVPIDDYQIHT